MSDSRFRIWEFVIFPVSNFFAEDSIPFDWFSFLVESKVPFVCVLHQPEQDEMKEHVHVIVCYDGKKSRAQVIEDFLHPNIPTVPANKFFLPVKSVTGAESYLTHCNQPSKLQYRLADLVCGNGYKLHVDETGEKLLQAQELMSAVLKHRTVWQFDDALGFVLREHPDSIGTFQRYAYCITNTLATSREHSKSPRA